MMRTGKAHPSSSAKMEASSVVLLALCLTLVAMAPMEVTANPKPTEEAAQLLKSDLELIRKNRDKASAIAKAIVGHNEFPQLCKAYGLEIPASAENYISQGDKEKEKEFRDQASRISINDRKGLLLRIAVLGHHARAKGMFIDNAQKEAEKAQTSLTAKLNEVSIALDDPYKIKNLKGWQEEVAALTSKMRREHANVQKLLDTRQSDWSEYLHEADFLNRVTPDTKEGNNPQATNKYRIETFKGMIDFILKPEVIKGQKDLNEWNFRRREKKLAEVELKVATVLKLPTEKQHTADIDASLGLSQVALLLKEDGEKLYDEVIFSPLRILQEAITARSEEKQKKMPGGASST